MLLCVDHFVCLNVTCLIVLLFVLLVAKETQNATSRHSSFLSKPDLLRDQDSGQGTDHVDVVSDINIIPRPSSSMDTSTESDSTLKNLDTTWCTSDLDSSVSSLSLPTIGETTPTPTYVKSTIVPIRVPAISYVDYTPPQRTPSLRIPSHRKVPPTVPPRTSSNRPGNRSSIAVRPSCQHSFSRDDRRRFSLTALPDSDLVRAFYNSQNFSSSSKRHLSRDRSQTFTGNTSHRRDKSHETSSGNCYCCNGGSIKPGSFQIIKDDGEFKANIHKNGRIR